jgi:hypothetical protein
MTKRNHEMRELTACELDAVTGGDKPATGEAKTTTKTPPKGPYLVYNLNQVLVSS